MLMPDTAKPLATYDHPFFGKWAAITRNQFGNGTFTYEGTHLSDELQRKLLADVVTLAGLAGSDQKLPAAVRVRHGAANSGRQMHYYLNYSDQQVSFPYAYGNGADVLTGKPVVRAASLTLGPWDLAIIEEQ
jgi:beta-galactosidase